MLEKRAVGEPLVRSITAPRPAPAWHPSPLPARLLRLICSAVTLPVRSISLHSFRRGAQDLGVPQLLTRVVVHNFPPKLQLSLQIEANGQQAQTACQGLTI